jgi:hypothetical protein
MHAAATSSARRVSTVLADALAAGRLHFNARVAEVRHRQSAFDVSAFTAFVGTGLDAVALSVAQVAPDRTAAVVAVAYDIAVDLVAQGLAGSGARTVCMDKAWTVVAPRCARLLAAYPLDVLGALCNAVTYLEGSAGARPSDWLDDMARLVARADSVEQLKLLGQVAAWRAGLAQFRMAALRAADALPAALALAAVGADDTVSAQEWAYVRQTHGADPWWCLPAARRESVRQGVEVGQFSGFGGSFAQPPQVRAHEAGFVVRSAERYSLLVADAYGAVLLPSTAAEYEAADGSIRPPSATLNGDALALAGRRIELDLPANGLAIVENEHSVALTSAYSHAVRVYPRA